MIKSILANYSRYIHSTAEYYYIIFYFCTILNFTLIVLYSTETTNNPNIYLHCFSSHSLLYITLFVKRPQPLGNFINFIVVEEVRGQSDRNSDKKPFEIDGQEHCVRVDRLRESSPESASSQLLNDENHREVRVKLVSTNMSSSQSAESSLVPEPQNLLNNVMFNYQPEMKPESTNLLFGGKIFALHYY